MEYFQISCNYIKSSLPYSKKLFNYLDTKDIKLHKCCFLEATFDEEDIIYYMCQSCRKVWSSKTDNQLLSIYELLDQDDTFEWPNYENKKYYLVDCYRDREHPEIHHAIRSILKKMHINYLEIEDNKEKSRYCGLLHYETKNEALKKQVESYQVEELKQLPEELQLALLEDFASQFGNDYDVITYCNRCTRDLNRTHVHAVHIMDLIFCEKDFQ